MIGETVGQSRMEQRPETCQAVAGAYAQGAPAPYGLTVRLGPTLVRVRSNVADIIEELTGHYREFLDDAGAPDVVVSVMDRGPVKLDLPFVERSRPGEAAKEDVVDLADGRVVRKRRTGLWLVFGPGGHCILGPCRDNLDQVVNYLNARAADRELRAGARLLHAAGVALGEAGLAIAGLAGAGKSTLALEIMRHDATFVSNDRLLVGPGRQGLVMTGIARMPRVNPGTILHNDRLAGLLTEAERTRFSHLSDRALRRLEYKYDVPIHACFGPGRFRLRARLRALAVLCWQPGGGALCSRWTTVAACPELLPAFMKDVGVFFEEGPRMAREADYLDLLAECPLLVLEGGVDFQRAATLCLDWLRASGNATACVA